MNCYGMELWGGGVVLGLTHARAFGTAAKRAARSCVARRETRREIEEVSMTADVQPTLADLSPERRDAGPRLWPPVVIVGAYWLAKAASSVFDIRTFASFLLTVAAGALAILSFTIWW